MTIPTIPESELVVEFSRSSGPGGQNVNKVNTKAQVRWHVGASRVLSFDQKELVRYKLSTKINHRDELLISSDDERTQLQNKQKAIAHLRQLVKRALQIPKKRIATKPTRSSKEKRLQQKSHRSTIKQARKSIFE